MEPKRNRGTALPRRIAAKAERAEDRVRDRHCVRGQRWRWCEMAMQGCDCEAGSTLLEMALSMVVLLTVLFGLIEMCLALYTYHYVSDAAREGSRYAIVHGATCSVSGASCTVGASGVQTYVQDLGYPGISSSNMTVTTTYSVYPAGGTCAAAGCNGPGDMVTVTAQYNFPLNIPFLTSQVLAIRSSSSMVIAQ